jgi:hypothetical protein
MRCAKEQEEILALLPNFYCRFWRPSFNGAPSKKATPLLSPEFIEPPLPGSKSCSALPSGNVLEKVYRIYSQPGGYTFSDPVVYIGKNF